MHIFEEELKEVGAKKKIKWESLPPELLYKKCRTAKGAAGPDQWTATEVKIIPTEAMELFIDITGRWEQVGRAPTVLAEARQTTLPNPGKEKKGPRGLELEAKNRRISVFSIWWRLWGSWWAAIEGVNKWRLGLFPDESVGGSGSQGAEEVGATSLRTLRETGMAEP